MAQSKNNGSTPLPQIVSEEMHLLDSVQQSISSSLSPANLPDYDKAMVRLRDQLADEKLPDDRAMILDQMDRLAALAETRLRYNPALPDVASSYFAHLRLLTDKGDRRDILLGKTTYVRDGVNIVDWRDAPISHIFYRYQEGEPFDEDIAERQMRGEVEARRTITIIDGKLTRVATPGSTFLRIDDRWHEHETTQLTTLYGGEGTAARPETTEPLLGISGGNTYHRSDKHLPEIAALLDSKQFDLLTSNPSSLLVVSGGAGSGKTTVALHRLAYLNFQNPKRFKPRRMLVLVFGLALSRYIARVLPALGVENVEAQTLERWTRAVFRKHFPKLSQHISPNTPASVTRFKTHRILIPMLEQATQAAPNADPSTLFDELFSREDYTPASRTDPPCYDEEDHMILLRLYQLLNGRLRWNAGRTLSYHHLMIDEAQDFGPLEILVLLQTVRDGSVTLAGDSAQKITDNDLSDWSEVLDLVGQGHIHISPLKVGYRSTREIMDFARAVLGDLDPDKSFVSLHSRRFRVNSYATSGLGCCGNNCSECGAYLATMADGDAKRKAVADEWAIKHNGTFLPEDINCVGCTAEGVHVGFAENFCTIRKCCMDKGHSTCAACESYPCEELEEFFKGVPEAKANLESVRG